jgi:hypothetical protein
MNADERREKQVVSPSAPGRIAAILHFRGLPQCDSQPAARLTVRSMAALDAPSE